MKLADMSCTPCRKSDTPISAEELSQNLEQLPGWEAFEVDAEMRLQKQFEFSTYVEGVAFANLLAKLAETQDHHPEIVIGSNKILVSWWTHAIRGLHLNDLISAAKTDSLYKELE